jgi:hypothetical protein
MPLPTSVSSSSPPRPKMKGSPLQPHHPLPLLRLLQQQLVDPLLRHAVVARLLADEDALGVAAHQRHHLVGDQPVIDHHVRLLHLAQGVQGEQARIAGPAPTSTTSPPVWLSSANRLSAS